MRNDPDFAQGFHIPGLFNQPAQRGEIMEVVFGREEGPREPGGPSEPVVLDGHALDPLVRAQAAIHDRKHHAVDRVDATPHRGQPVQRTLHDILVPVRGADLAQLEHQLLDLHMCRLGAHVDAALGGLEHLKQLTRVHRRPRQRLQRRAQPLLLLAHHVAQHHQVHGLLAGRARNELYEGVSDLVVRHHFVVDRARRAKHGVHVAPP
mmetsp:Transcript_33575/g.85787  ORF Transcript_33575/g.85787 Transcript_33575/m.85787 type:complete len:207 (-) Transcript_33575:176-796(-)